jgi:hypothetical protein
MKKHHLHSPFPLQYIHQTIPSFTPLMPSRSRIVLIPATQLQSTLVGLNILIQQILNNLVEDNIIIVSTEQLQNILSQITTLFQELLEKNRTQTKNSHPVLRGTPWRKYPRLPQSTPDTPY